MLRITYTAYAITSIHVVFGNRALLKPTNLIGFGVVVCITTGQVCGVMWAVQNALINAALIKNLAHHLHAAKISHMHSVI